MCCAGGPWMLLLIPVWIVFYFFALMGSSPLMALYFLMLRSTSAAYVLAAIAATMFGLGFLIPNWYPNWRWSVLQALWFELAVPLRILKEVSGEKVFVSFISSYSLMFIKALVIQLTAQGFRIDLQLVAFAFLYPLPAALVLSWVLNKYGPSISGWLSASS